eukprot:CAMPEP_0201490372 /NCGR_PEP_ID=MMETSP0151_2-20130828/26471_1 /ASSEMBLY_ACC=CAM_ASM_000257 /TAXON_ID=200890 /ORGANISM="Paramoeba atlantica, Strain 621/1 / CCAP 1560/9" /LENGTH=210 /DNA_ID=CAMNT_0047876331 /DNA_START=36 /DNA_END=668 /DNA_ORIENTATION=-
MKTFKKATGIGVTKVDPTKDEEYDEMKKRFKEINASVQAAQKGLKEQKRAWQQIADLSLKTAEAAKKAGDEGSEINSLGNHIFDRVTDWKTVQIDKDESLVEPLKDIDKMMDEFKDTSKMLSKREEALKELDYQRGEMEKARKSAKDKEAHMAKVQPDMEIAQSAYDILNKDSKDKMKELIEKKEHLLPLFVRSFVHANTRLAQSYPQFD